MALDLSDPVTRDIMGLPQVGEDVLLTGPFSIVAGTAGREKSAGASLVDFLSWCSEKTLERYQAAQDALQQAKTALDSIEDAGTRVQALSVVLQAEKQVSVALGLAIKSGTSRIAASAEARAIHQSVMDSPELRKAWSTWVDFLATRPDVRHDFGQHCAMRGVDVEATFAK